MTLSVISTPDREPAQAPAAPISVLSNAPHLFVVFAVLAVSASAGAVERAEPAFSEPTTIEKGPHHRTWASTREVQHGGKLVKEVRSYVELQNGLHRFDPNANDRVLTDPGIEPF